ncbi:hypothetical protein HYT53_04560 [Candidatus Woesearchaeota archaeon]|nr:hypothetical protein [Candidatus Woesearchaeota archaeon]
MLKKTLTAIAIVVSIVAFIFLIGWVISSLTANEYKDKAKSYDDLQNELTLCHGNLTQKQLQYNNLQKVKDTAIDALTKDKTELNNNLQNLGQELDSCNKTQQGKNLEIGNLKNKLTNCTSNQPNVSNNCPVALSPAPSDKTMFFGSVMDVSTIKIIGTISVITLITLLTIPFSLAFTINLKIGVVVSWFIANALTVAVQIILEVIEADLDFKIRSLITVVVFTVIFALFAYATRDWD